MAIKEADDVAVYICACGCGAIRIELLDGRGKPFAATNIPAEEAMDMALDILEYDPVEGEDSIGETAGNA